MPKFSVFLPQSISRANNCVLLSSSTIAKTRYENRVPNEDNKVLEVIYNSVCPVCDAGICRFQKKVDPAHGGFVWLDINKAPDRLSQYNIRLDDVRLKLHAIDREGQLRVGMEAVIVIFRETPNYKWLAFLASLPILKQVAAQLYNATAHILYKWNKAKGRW